MQRTERSIAHVLRDGLPVGLAFAVGERQLLTCAHVVNEALGRTQDDAKRPEARELLLEFPFGGDRGDLPVRRARLAAWGPERGAFWQNDVAGLALTEPLPAGVHFGRMTYDGSGRPLDVQMWGPSTRRETGGHVEGRLLGEAENGRLHVDQRSRGVFRAASGFSGGPVWHQSTGEIVGILHAVASGSAASDVYVLTAEVAADAWPEVLSRPSVCPYRGLSPFSADDAALFFGREDFIAQLVDAARRLPLVAVMGPSGCGKSSVVSAGLVASLRHATPSLAVISLRPGDSVLTSLAGALASATNARTPVPPDDIERWRGRLHEHGLGYALDLARQALGAQRCVLVLDQFEQVVAPGHAEPHRTAFLSILADHLAAGGHPAALVALSVRDDYFGPLVLAQPALGEYLQANTLPLRPMSESELRLAITRPALGVDPQRPVTVDGPLVDQLVDDFLGRAGELSLLQFTLTELWKHQRQRRLTLDMYREVGGLKALTRYADGYVDSLREDQQEQVRRLLCRIAAPDSSGTSRPALRRDLPATDWTMALRLADARLVVIGREPALGAETVEIAHEVLLRAWPRLQDWRRRDHEFLTWLAATEATERDWRDHDRDEGLLLRGTLLQRAEAMVGERRDEVLHLLEFIGASRGAGASRQPPRTSVERRLEANRLAGRAIGKLASMGIVEDRYLVDPDDDEKPTIHAVPLALAVLSVEKCHTVEGVEAMRRALGNRGFPVMTLSHRQDDEDSSGLRDEVISVTSSADGVLLATGAADHTARIWDGRSGLELRRLRHTGEVVDVAFNADASLIATACVDGYARIWDARSGYEIHRLDPNGEVTRVAFDPDGARLAAGCVTGFCVWNTQSGALITDGAQRWVSAVLFSPDGTLLAAGGDSGVIQVSNRARGGRRSTMKHASSVNALAFSPDGRLLASASGDALACLWNPRTGRRLGEYPHRSGVLSIAFSPDGTLLATGCEDGRVTVIDHRSGTTILRARHSIHHMGAVTCVGFPPGGDYFVSAGHDCEVRVWSMSTGAELSRFRDRGAVLCMAMPPPGTHVITGGYGGTVSAWPLASGTLLEQVRPVLPRDLTADEWRKHLPDEPYRRLLTRPSAAAPA